jgi:ADP-heptose:LPS heptosyltransferase
VKSIFFNDKKITDFFRAKHVTFPQKNINKYKLYISALYFSIQNAILQFLNRLIYSKKKRQPNRILIFRTGSLGDSICATPALSTIRKHFRGAQITLLTNAGSKNLVNPVNVISKNLFDDVIDYLGIQPFELYKILKKRKFDYIIQLPQVDASFFSLIRDLIFFRFIASEGWGWKVSRVLLFKKVLESNVTYPSESERLINLVKENGVETAENKFYLNISNDDKQKVEEYFLQNGIQGKKIIAVAVGANSVKNRWPINYFEEVIHHFHHKYPILLTGGKDDIELVSRFNGMDQVYNTCGMFTPMQSALLIKKSAVALCNDTGPLHLSYAVGTPVVGLFASRDFYGKWFPPESSINRTFRTPDIACSLCFFNACSNNICMQAIMPSDVISAVEELANLKIETR